MKRILISVLILSLCLSLCGCMGAEKDRQFMVSSLGFSQSGEDITVLAEVVIVNSETSDEAPTPKIFTATGKTIKDALDGISLYLTRPLLLEHCGVIVLDKKLSPKWFNKICEYCFYEKRITLSAYLVGTDDPNTLLSGKPESSVAVGYDIMGLIEQRKATTDKPYKNRFFEIESKREEGEKSFSLPLFTRKEEDLFLDGKYTFQAEELVK